MTTDYRAELQLLFDAAESFTEPALGHHRPWATALERARALLAQPVAEGPTDEELLDIARATDLVYYMGKGSGFASPYIEGTDIAAEVLAFACAAIARWGRLTPQPVAVSERLPGPEDCDAEGRCWMFGNVEGDWRLISTINPGIPKLKYCFSHWLPANVLPIPEATVYD